jgi:hypothetical protein
MSSGLIAAIALLCQVTGTYGSVSVSAGHYSSDRKSSIELTYDIVQKAELSCQKYYIKCFKNSGDLDQCVLDRK